MGARELHHAAKLKEWEAKIRDCRSSGQTVTGWCQDHGIKPKTYYRWERSYLAEATKALTKPVEPTPLVRIDPEYLPVDKPGQIALTGIRLLHGATSIELPATTDPEAVAALVAALNRHV